MYNFVSTLYKLIIKHANNIGNSKRIIWPPVWQWKTLDNLHDLTIGRHSDILNDADIALHHGCIVDTFYAYLISNTLVDICACNVCRALSDMIWYMHLKNREQMCGMYHGVMDSTTNIVTNCIGEL